MDSPSDRQHLQVEAICQGTVIDHIPAGQGLKIIDCLQRINNQVRLTVGLNLASQQRGCKDLIKIDHWLLSDNEASQLAVFAPDATINIIRQYQVTRKTKVHLPTQIVGLFACPNSNCISTHEPIETKFYTQPLSIQLRCHYCEKYFSAELLYAK